MLTDDEISNIGTTSQQGLSPHEDTHAFARAIEAAVLVKLREGDVALPSSRGHRDIDGDWVDRGVAIKDVIDYGDRRVAAAVPQWLPIESAPIDGTAILGHWANGTYDCSIYAVKCLDGKWWQTNEDFRVATPTHWMPLPAAPKEPT